MAESVETARSLVRRGGVNRSKAAGIAFGVIALLASVRAGCEWAMMWEYGNDPQMPIWHVLSLTELALWFIVGSVPAYLLVVFWPKRWAALIGSLLIIAWAIAISRSSWQYLRARQALADAASPATSAERLSELVHFDGIQAGYELDNRIASNPSTPPEALRELSQRDQEGTRMCLLRNPNTPLDVLQELTHNKDIGKIRERIRKPKRPGPIPGEPDGRNKQADPEA